MVFPISQPASWQPTGIHLELHTTSRPPLLDKNVSIYVSVTSQISSPPQKAVLSSPCQPSTHLVFKPATCKHVPQSTLQQILTHSLVFPWPSLQLLLQLCPPCGIAVSKYLSLFSHGCSHLLLMVLFVPPGYLYCQCAVWHLYLSSKLAMVFSDPQQKCNLIIMARAWPCKVSLSWGLTPEPLYAYTFTARMTAP